MGTFSLPVKPRYGINPITNETSVRKIKEGLVTIDLYAFLTTDANGVVRPIHDMTALVDVLKDAITVQ